MTTKTACAGAKGFDVNQPLSESQALAFKNAGYDFCIRYIPRNQYLGHGDLTAAEIEILLAAGLNLGIVQHVSPDNWMPSPELGAAYGAYAAQYAGEIGLPLGVNIFLDLEMVAPTATPAVIIAYCTSWFNLVSAAGYVPGLYVGWQTGLTSQQLYDLPFKHYWKGYNADIPVATRGYQLLQKPQLTLDGVVFDPNICQADELGDLPVWVSV